ncbi:MAG: S8 family serine peptidase [Armatimonadetes bacterium]|nr:S8 family serine peptidase [Armatimonadota bacterium]
MIRTILIVCLGLHLFGSASDAARTLGGYKAGEILVKFKPGAPARDIVASHRATVREVVPRIDVYCLRLPPGLAVSEAVEKFSRNPNVVFASPNHIIYATVLPNDDWFEWFQWGLYNTDGRCDIHAPEAWDLQKGSASTIIAIVDTGIESEHPDLADKVIQGYNAIDGTTDTEDDHMHGTFVAGIAAASTDNYEGIAGVDWYARLMPVKVLAASGECEEIDAAEGIIWAVSHGAKIINFSVGTYLDVPALEAAVNEAWDAGAVVVCAGGNDDLDDATSPHYPSYYPKTIAVGATNEYDERCTADDWFEGGSNYGDSLDVMAPGNWILSTAPTWYETLLGVPYEFASGTSAAAPFVSGLAGLIWAAHPSWTNQQVRDQIEQTCDDIDSTGWDRYTGWGRINAYRALSESFELYPTIGSLRSALNGTVVKLPERPVTAGTTDFTDRFYIEEPDRSAGIMVYYGSTVTTPTSIGDNAQVSGTLSVVEGKRAITNPRVTIADPGSVPTALSMNNKTVGGKLDPYGGVTGGQGLANTGLLVQSWGRVTAVGWNYFYMDDGSRRRDGSGFTGLKVYTGSLARPVEQDYLVVTGISSLEIPVGTEVRIPVVRPRRQSDIHILN